jgi:ketosteroid isomerase-like protein
MSSIDGPGTVLQAAQRLAGAFRARDLHAAMDCFAEADDIAYVGSEPGERANGRAAVAALLTEVFARPEAYSWNIQEANVFARDGVAYLSCEATGHVSADAGHEESFPYRLSGLLEHSESGWLWRACHGCEPSSPAS